MAEPNQSDEPQLPPELQESLQTLIDRIFNNTAKRELWKNRFTSADRRKFPQPEAETLEQVIEEMLMAKTSERQGRLIDHDQSGSMEEKKREGYF